MSEQVRRDVERATKPMTKSEIAARLEKLMCEASHAVDAAYSTRGGNLPEMIQRVMCTVINEALAAAPAETTDPLCMQCGKYHPFQGMHCPNVAGSTERYRKSEKPAIRG